MVENFFTLGSDSNSTGICIVDGAIANVNGFLAVGSQGSGELVIANGGGGTVSVSTFVSPDLRVEMIGTSILNSDVQCHGTFIAGKDARITGDFQLINAGQAEIEMLEVSGVYDNRGESSTITVPGGVVEIGGNYQGSAPFEGEGTISFAGQITMVTFRTQPARCWAT